MAKLINSISLKYSPEKSNTRAFIEQSEKIFHDLQVSTEVIRVNDYYIKWGTSSQEGDDDEWPEILQKIKQKHTPYPTNLSELKDQAKAMSQ